VTPAAKKTSLKVLAGDEKANKATNDRIKLPGEKLRVKKLQIGAFPKTGELSRANLMRGGNSESQNEIIKENSVSSFVKVKARPLDGLKGASKFSQQLPSLGVSHTGKALLPKKRLKIKQINADDQMMSPAK
jgi:hypothetical protein